MKWKQFFTPATSINTLQARDYIENRPGESYTLLDVRQPSEYRDGHLPGAVLIPLTELSDRAGELDPKKPVLVY